MPRQGPKEWWPGRKQGLSRLSANVGRRVRLVRSVDRFPDFSVLEGKTGTVVLADMEEIWVRMDEFIAGAEQWDNQVQWSHSNDTFDDFEKDTRFLT